ncbi:DbpA RNA binding domain-containing protein, partial [Luteimonas sp. SDU101]|uniref:DbpA RNA binding domain-containing protein n=1 Tax=Luteimonas sp. SDU101 TaxID=3422593 RepID=UPI003EBD4133
RIERRERESDGVPAAPAPPAAGRPTRNEGEALFDDERAPPARPQRERPARTERAEGDPAFPMETFRIEVGHMHGVQPGNIVGAIANEADLESRYIGRIDIRDDHSLVDLPQGMPREVLEHLKKVWVSGQQLRMRRADDEGRGPPRGRPGPRPGGKPPGKAAGPRGPRP